MLYRRQIWRLIWARRSILAGTWWKPGPWGRWSWWGRPAGAAAVLSSEYTSCPPLRSSKLLSPGWNSPWPRCRSWKPPCWTEQRHDWMHPSLRRMCQRDVHEHVWKRCENEIWCQGGGSLEVDVGEEEEQEEGGEEEPSLDHLRENKPESSDQWSFQTARPREFRQS